MSTERRYTGTRADDGVEHQRVLPDVQNLSYAGSTTSGDEQFSTTPWAVSGGVTGARIPLGAGASEHRGAPRSHRGSRGRPLPQRAHARGPGQRGPSAGVTSALVSRHPGSARAPYRVRKYRPRQRR